MKIAFVKTPIGLAEIQGDENGVSNIHLKNEEIRRVSKVPQELEEAVSQIQEYFEGNRTQFTFLLNPSGTKFQKKVWQELLKIPFGKTSSYMELSKRLGDVKAIRAVASANGKNPLWIVIPCHRVIGNNNTLTGYAGGLEKKKWLLQHEHNFSPVKEGFLF